MKASPAWSRTLGRGGSERPPASGSPVSTAGAETSKAASVPGTRSSEPTSRAPRLQTPAFWDREAADVCRPGPRLAAHCGGLGKPTRGSARAPSPEKAPFPCPRRPLGWDRLLRGGEGGTRSCWGFQSGAEGCVSPEQSWMGGAETQGRLRFCHTPLGPGALGCAPHGEPADSGFPGRLNVRITACPKCSCQGPSRPP